MSLVRNRRNDLADDELSGATVDFSVRQSYLDELGVDASEVTLYRGTDDGWEPLPTDQHGETETHLEYNATTPGFSVFAIGTGAPTVTVSDAELDERTVTVGESATVTATVENRGQQSGEHTANLTVDGEVVDSRTVELNDEESTEVEFSDEPETTGDFELAVDETSAGTLILDEPQEEERTLWPWIVLVVVILILVGWWRRRDEDDEDTANPR